MKIHFGYAVISKTLEAQKLFKTITYTNYQKEKNNDKLKEIIDNNIEGFFEILKYNVKNNIHFYRLNSSLIPLATHQNVHFSYQEYIKLRLNNLGKYIQDNNLRIDTHPDQYCVLNSTKKEVVASSIEILKYEASILNMLKITPGRIILHIGSKERSKEEGIKRFIKNFALLDPSIQKTIAIENDDKVYNIIDTLRLAQKLNIPMVLDYHHYLCNHETEKLEDYFKQILATWKGEVPKIHFSSPKSKLKKDFRSHHDYINVQEFIKFIGLIKEFNQDFDVMIEAKMKDEAMFRLLRELKYLTNYHFLDETTLII